MDQLVFASALLALCSFGYAADVYILWAYGMDLAGLYGHGQTPKVAAQESIRLALKQTLVIFIGLTSVQLGLPKDAVHWLILSIVLALLLGYRGVRSPLMRVLRGGLSPHGAQKLGDIIVGDVLVSFASVLSDIGMCAYHGFRLARGKSVEASDARVEFREYAPLITGFCNGIRIKQTVTDWYRTGNRRNLANTGKYLCSNAFAVLKPYETPYTSLFRWVSFCYNLFWDIRYDWGLFQGRRLRFPMAVYVCAVVLDVSARLVVLQAGDSDNEVLFGQFVELSRRCGWVVLRVESEPQVLPEMEL